MEVSFYRLKTSSLEKALARLLEKVVSGGNRAEVVLDSQLRLKAVDSILWTYSSGVFLPHGHQDSTVPSGTSPKEHPIWLTLQATGANDANVVVITTGMRVENPSIPYERCVDLFDGNDPSAVESADERIDFYRRLGHTVQIWQQDLKGSWKKGDA